MAKLINQGAYGCVYYPGFTCKGNTNKQKEFITKLEIYDRTSKNEIEISNKIKKIKNFSKFFGPVINHCITLFSEINKNRDKLQDCKAVNIDNHEYNDFLLIYIKYIESKDIDKYLLDIEIPSIYLSKILNCYNYTLNSIEKLQKHNIIHYDLHTGNIIYNLKTNVPIIIDFGLAIDKTKIINTKNKINYLQLKKSTMHYSPKHYTYPPELHFITYVLSDIDEKNIEKNLKKKINEEDINIFVNNIFEENKIQKRYIYYIEEKYNIKIDKYSYKKELEKYYKKFSNKTKKEVIDTLFEKMEYLDYYTATIDYCIILIKKIDRIIMQDSIGKNNTIIKIIFFLLELLSINLTVDTENRFTLKEYITINELIFQNNNSSSKVLENIKKDKNLSYKIEQNKNHYISLNFKILDDTNVRDFFEIIKNSII